MRRNQAGILFLAVWVVFWAGAAQADPPAGVNRAEFRKTCAHYENRARYMPRDSGAGFIATLADSCRSALNRLVYLHQHLSPRETRLARDYLKRLSEFRRAVLGVNMTLFEEFRQLQPWETAGERMSVTPSGEYLIARYMGLMDAYANWASESGYEVAVQN